jgi:hypothetical protein
MVEGDLFTAAATLETERPSRTHSRMKAATAGVTRLQPGFVITTRHGAVLDATPTQQGQAGPPW